MKPFWTLSILILLASILVYSTISHNEVFETDDGDETMQEQVEKLQLSSRRRSIDYDRRRSIDYDRRRSIDLDRRRSIYLDRRRSRIPSSNFYGK